MSATETQIHRYTGKEREGRENVVNAQQREWEGAIWGAASWEGGARRGAVGRRLNYWSQRPPFGSECRRVRRRAGRGWGAGARGRGWLRVFAAATCRAPFRRHTNFEFATAIFGQFFGFRGVQWPPRRCSLSDGLSASSCAVLDSNLFLAKLPRLLWIARAAADLGVPHYDCRFVHFPQLT